MQIEKNKDTLSFGIMLATKTNEDIKKRTFYDSLSETTLTKEMELMYSKNPLTRDFGIKKLKRKHTTITKNPYYQSISLKDINLSNIKYEVRKLPARTILKMDFFNVKNIFNQSKLDYGYYDRVIDIPMLIENDKTIWMSITEMEIATADFAVKAAHGDVLTFGLGLGYYPFMCLQKKNVSSVTIVEINPLIIKIFKEFILPQFPEDLCNKINIIEGSLFDYFTDDFLGKFDYIFVDTWDSNTQGEEHYAKLLESNVDIDKYGENIGFWIEEAILHPYMLLTGVYLSSIITDSFDKVIKNYESKNTTIDRKNAIFLKKADKYFSNTDIFIQSSKDIQQLMTNKSIIRKILKTNI